MCRARILLADDHVETAEQLRLLLETEFDVVNAVQDGRALVSAAERFAPDVIVADISMPRLDGIGAATLIRHGNPQARIVFVTMYADPVLVHRSLAIGAMGYVLKLSAGEELVPAVHAALDGRRYVSEALRFIEGAADPPSAR